MDDFLLEHRKPSSFRQMDITALSMCDLFFFLPLNYTFNSAIVSIAYYTQCNCFLGKFPKNCLKYYVALQ